MPQQSSTTYLIGQVRGNSPATNGTDGLESTRVLFDHSDPATLGPSQERISSAVDTDLENAGDHAIKLQVPTGVTLDPPLPGVSGRGPRLQARQLWEGTVIESGDDGFVATLSDKTNPDNPDEHARFAFELVEVSEGDRKLIQPGAAFYWTIGSERTPGGQVKNVSMIQFRRLPAWTRSSLHQAATQGKRVRELFRAPE